MNRGDTEQLLSQLQLHGVQPPTWRDPRKVATHEWLPGALDHIWQGGTGDDDESADGAVECVQLELSSRRGRGGVYQILTDHTGLLSDGLPARAGTLYRVRL